MFKHSLPSIEKFAAYLDGNLPQSEMQQISQMAEHDDVLHQLLDVSTMIDNTMGGYTADDLQLPEEIIGSDFVLPQITSDGITPSFAPSLEPMDDMHVAAAACADDGISMFSDINPEDHSTIGGELQDDPSNLMPEDDGFGSGDDLSSSFPDD